MAGHDSGLPPVSQAELDKAIKSHAMYSEGSVGGARAVLTDRDLSGLNFRGANMSGADFSHSIFSYKFHLCFTIYFFL